MKQEHCQHKEDWEEYKKLREQIIAFTETKKTLNNITQQTITELKEEINQIQNKIDRLQLIFITAFLTLIITLITKSI